MNDGRTVGAVVAAAGLSSRMGAFKPLLPFDGATVIERCVDEPSDVAAYKENRDALYGGLTELGYECVAPQGAFYLWVRSLEPDATAFAERAKALGPYAYLESRAGRADRAKTITCLAVGP